MPEIIQNPTNDIAEMPNVQADVVEVVGTTEPIKAAPKRKRAASKPAEETCAKNSINTAEDCAASILAKGEKATKAELLDCISFLEAVRKDTDHRLTTAIRHINELEFDKDEKNAMLSIASQQLEIALHTLTIAALK